MPIDCYDGKSFELDSTSGEAQALFGKVSTAPGAQPPILTISIDKQSSVVSFALDSAQPDAGRDFVKEAEARYIDGENFNSRTWPDAYNDVIIGHINWGVKDKQQMFLMWVRRLAESNTSHYTHRLGFFFFANQTRFSGGSDALALPGVGQDDGGGGGLAPPKKP